MNAVCWRRWVLADLTFIIPLASCILPMLNYSRALTCLKLANNKLFRCQWTLLCQIHIFRAWFCYSKHTIKLGHFPSCSKQLGRMLLFLKYCSCLYLVELLDSFYILGYALKRSFSPDQFKLYCLVGKVGLQMGFAVKS